MSLKSNIPGVAQRHSAIVKMGLIAVMLMAVPVACVYQEIRYCEAVRPEAGVDSLSTFLDTKRADDIYTIETFVEDSKDYIVVTGKFDPPYLALPAGPPVYIFSRSGRLVDWCQDSGNNIIFMRKWSFFAQSKKISIDAARQWVKRL